MSKLTIRGLPQSLARDGWWLSDLSETTPPKVPNSSRAGGAQDSAPSLLVFLLVVCVVITDVLFWKQPVGISLIVFSATLTAVALLNLRPDFSRKEWTLAGALWIAAALPMVEYLQTTSVLFLMCGHFGVLIWSLARSEKRPVLQSALSVPAAFLSFMSSMLRSLGSKSRGISLKQQTLVEWSLPAIVGAVFLVLLVGANPVFEQWASDLGNLTPETVLRWAFWGAAAALILPFVLFKTFASYVNSVPDRTIVHPKLQSKFINARAIVNSLIVFNVMFLLQNLSDIAILFGGASLPEGMTYATYAHRGAYPLMATSILAGLFALISRPFVAESKLLKSLLLIWIVQNVILVGAALLRLDLYVDAYGLTYLRLRAGIGMCLVVIGMVLLVWQLHRKKSNTWLTRVFSVIVVTIFYAGSFVNFSNVVAAENLSREGQKLDTEYLCRDTKDGMKAITDYTTQTNRKPCGVWPLTHEFATQNWRGWSYRSARLAAYQATYREIYEGEGTWIVTPQRRGHNTSATEIAR